MNGGEPGAFVERPGSVVVVHDSQVHVGCTHLEGAISQMSKRNGCPTSASMRGKRGHALHASPLLLDDDVLP